MEYKIEVMLTPDGSHMPYFWCILRYENEKWYNNGHGWTRTPEDAWKEAYEYYNDNILT